MEDSQGIFAGIRQGIAAEYSQHHDVPWIIGFSGGKDSTLVTHLVFEHVLSLPKSERTRAVHIVANDTLVESPPVIDHLRTAMSEIRLAVQAFDLPFKVAITRPNPDKTFWVNLIGRGYPSPKQNFRWCTDRMKIQPTSDYIKQASCLTGATILLLGVRRSESAARSRSAARYDNGGRLNDHNSLKDCKVFRPILELEADDVWEFLAENRPPWGGSHDRLIRLYRDATGGECPVVTSIDDGPACGGASPRFGCWTCTVVKKDKSLVGFVEAGFEDYQPLVEFRDWLISIRDDPERRLMRRRDGRVVIRNGDLIPSGFTIKTRKEILDRLLALQIQCQTALISMDEIEKIKEIWASDVIGETDRRLSEIASLGNNDANQGVMR